MRNYTDKSYWNKYWDKEKRENIQFYFDVLLDQYIVWENVKSYMEVGGAPGSIMAYMYRKHNLKVFTIDFSERERIENYLDYQQIKDYYIYTQDFQSFSTNENKEKYDIVASWGFIEHFEKDITTNFIEKKKQMVSEGGYLIVELPNIRKFIWFLYWIFNRKLIGIHNLKIMDLDYLKSEILKDEKYDLLFGSYFFAINKQNDFFQKHKKLCSICEKMMIYFREHNVNDKVKKWFFPYIVLIAKNKERKNEKL